MAEPCAPTSSILDWGFAAASLPGQAACGDAHLVCPFEDSVLMAVVDGLGHGVEAAAAADQAVDTLRAHPGESLIRQLRHCHRALTGTRGVVMIVAVFDGREQTLTWLGVGNVQGVLHRADPQAVPRSEGLLSRGGVVGLQLPILQASVMTVSAGDLLVFATDGVGPAFAEQVVPARPQAMASQLLTEHAKGTDDALVLVGRYRGM